MLSVSNTTIRPDPDRPGSATGSAGTFGLTQRQPATIGPDYPESRRRGPVIEPGRDLLGHYARRIGAPLTVLSAVALMVVGVANVQVARERDTVEKDLATARVAAARLADHLNSGNLDAVEADLNLLTRAAGAARTGSTGPGWAIADRADLGGTQVRALRRDTDQVALLAAEGAALQTVLAPLGGAGVAGRAMTGPEGPNGLYALDDLARGLNRYATTAHRIADPSAPAIGRAALAASLLPSLAGGEGPRSWTVCRKVPGPCLRATVTEARSDTPVRSAATDAGAPAAPGTTSPPGRRWAAGTDLLAIGIEWEALFRPGGTFDASAVFELLVRLDRNSKAPPAVTVHSAVGSEQQALEQLGRS